MNRRRLRLRNKGLCKGFSVLYYKAKMQKAIQETDNDAFSCKISAISKKYLPSPAQKSISSQFENYEDIHMEFCKEIKSRSRRKFGSITKACRQSFPVMNYGTYLRTVSIDLKLSEWLQNHSSKVQVLNLGCGSDLRMLPFLASNPNMQWIDLDYKEIVGFKATIFQMNEKFRAALQLQPPAKDTSETQTFDSIISERYQLLPCNITDTKQLISVLERFSNPNIPTVIISECVLCYLDQDKASQLITNITNFYKEGFWLSYDPIGGSDTNDRFGSIMQDNLRESRQLNMPTLMIYNSQEKYKSRFPGKTEIQTMWFYYQNLIDETERQRLKRLQFLDEIEELQVIFSHYVICTSLWSS